MFESKAKKEKTVILQTRDIVLLFVFFIVVLMVVFTIGLLVGRTFSGRETELAASQPEPGVTGPVHTPGGEEPAPAIQEITLPATGEGTEPAGVPPRGQISSGTDTVPSISEPATPPATPPAATPKPAPSTPPVTAPKPAPTTPVPASKPTPQPTPAPATVAAPGATVYMVQAMATGDINAATKMVDMLKAKGYSAAIQNPAPGSKDQYYRVYAGKFTDQRQARALIERLRKDGFDVFLKKLEE